MEDDYLSTLLSMFDVDSYYKMGLEELKTVSNGIGTYLVGYLQALPISEENRGEVALCVVKLVLISSILTERLAGKSTGEDDGD